MVTIAEILGRPRAIRSSPPTSGLLTSIPAAVLRGLQQDIHTMV